jgi:hypothetical protein
MIPQIEVWQSMVIDLSITAPENVFVGPVSRQCTSPSGKVTRAALPTSAHGASRVQAVPLPVLDT